MSSAQNRNFLPYLFTIVIIVTLAMGFFYFQLNYQSKIGGDFTLNHGDQSWVFSKNSKKLNLIYFGYTKCPDVCPLSMSYASQAFQKLTTKELSEVQLLFINLDYEHDIPNSVATYAAQFYPEFIGLTGAKEQVDFVVNLFKTSYFLEKDPKSYLGYSIAHADRIFLINKNGYLIDSIQGPRSNDVIIQKIKENL